MSGLWSNKDQEWWNKPENRFVFNFTLVFTSPTWQELFETRTPETQKLRDEKLKTLFLDSLKGDSKNDLLDEITTKINNKMIAGEKINALTIVDILDSFREATK